MNSRTIADFSGKITIPRSTPQSIKSVMIRARKIIQILCKEADSIDVGDFVLFNKLIELPSVYHCNGVKVRFIPGWGVYEIEGHDFRLPDSAEKIHNDIAAVNSLKHRLAHPSNRRRAHDITTQFRAKMMGRLIP